MPPNQNFCWYPTNRNMCYITMCHQHVYKISNQYLYFWLYNGQKTSNGNDVTSLNNIFGISNCFTTKQITFLESWDKMDKKHVFKENFISKIWHFLPELHLTLGQKWKWVSPSNPKFQMTHKTCVTRHSSYIFIWWPHVTWPWPLPVLCISSLFTWHLRHPFSSIFAGFAAVSGLALAADKAKRVRFGLWPDVDPKFDLVKKILRLH